MSIHSNHRRLAWRLAALALSTACLSCGAGPASSTTSATATPISRALPTDLVSTMQKPNGSRITVRYRVEGTATINQPVTITLVFDVVTDDTATVRLTADPELLMSGVAAKVTLPKGSSELSLQATPRSDGLFYVNVFTTQAGATSVISVPVQSGNTAPKLSQQGEAKQAPDGERLIALPVP